MNLAEPLKDELLLGKFWTDRWHLVSGCTPVSPGCLNCWFAAEARVREHNPHPSVRDLHQGLLTADKKHFNGTVRCNEHLLDKPLRARKPRVYAVWSDLFHEMVSREFILKAFATIAREKQHHFIIVTKRPHIAVQQLGKNGFLFPNVTILVTMEDQQRANERAPYALQLAAMGWRVGALCEPLLGPVDLRQITIPDEPHSRRHNCLNGYSCDTPWGYVANNLPDPFSRGKFSWLITGGESGPNARPCHPDWVRFLRDQAQAAGVPFLFKNWGTWRPVDPDSRGDHVVDGMIKTRPGEIFGRWLDGRCWTEVPE